MNVTTAYQLVRRRLGLGATDTAALADSDILPQLNVALQQISAERDWPWLYVEATGNTVADVSDITPGATWSRTVYVGVAGRNLQLAQDQDIYRYGSTPATGQPSAYAVVGNKLRLYPTPNGVYPYTHALYQFEPTLAAGGDTPLLPDAYSGWWIDETALLLPTRVNSPERLNDIKESIASWRKRAYDQVVRTASGARIRRTKPSIWQDV